MFTQLLWKEWRENLWKLGFCLIVSLAFSTLLFRVRLFTDFATCIGISLAMCFAVPLIYALDLFAGEMSNRTIHLLFKIPVPRWQIFFSKIGVAMMHFLILFTINGLVMEILAQGRETQMGHLCGIQLIFCLCAMGLFAWFSVFGCQNRSEAASLVVLTGVLIGWGIVFFWSTICTVAWAAHLVPYTFFYWATGRYAPWLSVPWLLCAQLMALGLALALACYRYVKIRRYL